MLVAKISLLLRNIALFLAAAFLTCLAINVRLSSPLVFGLTQKLEYLAEHPEVDTVFIGSSRVFHAFDPRQFDRELAARGIPSQSFNLGIDGMRPPESFYVLREVLRQRPQLQRVFIELVDIFPKVDAANFGSARYFHWHDWRHTQLVLRQVLESHEPLREKLTQAAVHAACFLVRTSNLGRGPELVATLLRGPARTPPNPWQENAGFAAQLTPRLTGPREESFRRVVTMLETRELGQMEMPKLCASALREIVGEVRATGAQPIFVLSPTIQRGENFTDFAAAGLDAPLIAFNDPRKYPAIFRCENHRDEQHLNATGAAEYTRALAEEFARLR